MTPLQSLRSLVTAQVQKAPATHMSCSSLSATAQGPPSLPFPGDGSSHPGSKLPMYGGKASGHPRCLAIINLGTWQAPPTPAAREPPPSHCPGLGLRRHGREARSKNNSVPSESRAGGRPRVSATSRNPRPSCSQVGFLPVSFPVSSTTGRSSQCRRSWDETGSTTSALVIVISTAR